MAPEPHPVEEASRGETVEATLWSTVTRLRARGWHISLWEIQRAQDVIAYLFTRLGRPPTDDELYRHLRPILCGRESELAPFSEVFRGSTSAAPTLDAAAGNRSRRRRGRLLGIAVAAVLAALIAIVILLPGGTASTTSGHRTGIGLALSTWVWIGVAVVAATATAGLLWLALRKRLRRRPAPRDPGHDLELHWATDHPLDTVECVRIARSLRIRARERGHTLDVRRTVEASIRAGLRLTPCFVEHRRLPEYLAVIEQRSAHDVLAAYHAKVVEQVGAQGVAVRRIGLQPRSPLVVDPVRGRRRLETLQPASERERLLLFAHDRSLRDPFDGRPRPWLNRFDRWSETIQIGPDVDRERPLPAVDRAVTDVRCLDPAWARAPHGVRSGASPVLPALFEAGDESWIEPSAPSGPDVDRALALLATSLGPDGWYWLSACALYPQISYELTVALGRLLTGDHGEPVATHVDVTMLARLPWFRHAFMPDWLRAALVGTLPQGQLAEARDALDQILVSGLLGPTDGAASLSVAEPRPGAGGQAGDPTSRKGTAAAQDRVYLDGSALRRHRLAAAAPRQLVAALRRQRDRFPAAVSAADAPAPRVRRALAWMNGLLVVVTLANSVLIAWSVIEGGLLSAWWQFAEQSIRATALTISLLALMPGIVVLTFSLLSRRPRGCVIGGSSVVFLAALFLSIGYAGASDDALAVVLLVVRLVTLASTLAGLLLNRGTVPVQWATFQRRNRTTFLVSAGTLVVGTSMVAALNAGLPAVPEQSSTAFTLVVEAAMVIGLYGGGPVLLGAAYFAGVRLIPLGAGAMIIFFGIDAAFTSTVGPGLLFCPAALLVLAAFYWQLRRTAERPPPDFWETRWREWKWPLAVLAVAGTMLVAWLASEEWSVTLACGAVPAVIALLTLAHDLATDHLAGFVQRHRLGARIPLHFD